MTTKTMEMIRAQDQQALADRYNRIQAGERIRAYRVTWVIATMDRYLPRDHVALAHRLQAMHDRIHKRDSRTETMERVDGGLGAAVSHERLKDLSRNIKSYAGYQAAALTAGGRNYYACLTGICRGDTQAELCRRLKLSEKSVRTVRRFVQDTLQALQIHADKEAVDTSSKIAA